MESDSVGEHGGLHQVPLQDRPKVFRGSDCGNAGSGGYYFLAHREREHHQQLGLQDFTRPKKIPEQVRQHTEPLGADRQGAFAGIVHQHGEPSRTEVQGSVFLAGRHTVGGICHRSVIGGILHVHDRRKREDGTVRPRRQAGRQP